METVRIRILLADDHSPVRQGFRRILEGQPDMTIVGEASNGRIAVEMAGNLRPDILVMDLTMPQLNGIEATREITEHYPRTRVVALSMQKDGVYVREMLKAGARAYVLKDCTEYDLVSAVRAVALGNAWLSPDVVSIVIDDYRKHAPEPIDLLSPREREVLQMIAEGKSNKDIGVQLNLSVYTVEAHRGRVMEKLNLHSGTELVRFAVRQGMVA